MTYPLAKPIRSRTQTHTVIAVAGDWACDADVRVDARGNAVVVHMHDFECDADEGFRRVTDKTAVPDDAIEQLTEAAIAAYYEATDLDDSDPPDPWRD